MRAASLLNGCECGLGQYSIACRLCDRLAYEGCRFDRLNDRSHESVIGLDLHFHQNSYALRERLFIELPGGQPSVFDQSHDERSLVCVSSQNKGESEYPGFDVLTNIFAMVFL